MVGAGNFVALNQNLPHLCISSQTPVNHTMAMFQKLQPKHLMVSMLRIRAFVRDLVPAMMASLTFVLPIKQPNHITEIMLCKSQHSCCHCN